MRTKLNDLTIAKLKHQKAQVTYWDATFPAFGVRVGALRKTFIVMHGKERKRIKIGTYPQISLADARRAADRLLHPNSTYSVTVSEALDEYLKSLTTRPRTAQDYTRLLNRHLVPKLGSTALISLTARDILAITDKLRDTPSEQRHAHVAMKVFFNWCVPRYLQASPMNGLKSTKQTSRERVLSYEELAKVWTAASTLGEFGSIIKLCILTGQRRGEISQKSLLTFDTYSMTIPAKLAKNHKEHCIPLSSTSYPLLISLTNSKILWGKRKAQLDQLSEVTNWVIHDLRRTFATNLADLTVSPHIIERLLNHSAPQSLGGNLGITYNRAQYLSEMRAALELYEAELVKRGVIPHI